jgi:hypothetical protein
MVNNSININKVNNHLKPSLTEHEKNMTYDLGNSSPCLGQAQKCGSVKSVSFLHTNITLNFF